MLFLYLRAHHGIGVLIGFLVLAVVDVTLGSVVLAFPALGGTSTGFPLRVDLPIGFAGLAVGSLASRMAGPEETAGFAHRKWERRHVAAASLLSVAVAAATELAVSGERMALMAVRATVLWLGLALLSGRALGWRHAWLGPVASIFPTTYLSQDGRGRDVWWDWVARPPGSWASAVLAAAVFALGVAAFELTPWRLAGLRGRASRPAPRTAALATPRDSPIE